jgi:uncharacterized YccA/Bax inhibitor family protein
MAATAFKTSNPALKAFQNVDQIGARPMTVNGTSEKTALLLILATGTAALAWRWSASSPDSVGGMVAAGFLLGFVVAMVTIFRPQYSPITAPIYAVLEGLGLGALSAAFNKAMPGLPAQAVMLTFGVLFGMLVIYRTGIIQVTQGFRAGVAAATIGIAGFYFIAFIASMFGSSFGATAIYGYGLFGIGFSAFVVVIASLNLILDFDRISRYAEAGAPQYMEWYGAFSLMITLVWLYLEILRLLSKLRSR